MLTNWLSCQFHLCPFTNRLSRNFCALKVIASTTFFSCCCWSGLDRRCSYRMTDAETNANKTKKGKGTFYKRYVETSLLARSSCLIVQKSHLMEEQTLCIDTTVVVYWTAAICILSTMACAPHTLVHLTRMVQVQHRFAYPTKRGKTIETFSVENLNPF